MQTAGWNAKQFQIKTEGDKNGNNTHNRPGERFARNKSGSRFRLPAMVLATG